MEIASVLGAFAGGVGGGLYAAQVIKRKVSNLELEFGLQDKAIRLLNERLNLIEKDVDVLRRVTQAMDGMFGRNKTQYEELTVRLSQELNKINSKINSIPRRKK